MCVEVRCVHVVRAREAKTKDLQHDFWLEIILLQLSS